MAKPPESEQVPENKVKRAKPQATKATKSAARKQSNPVDQKISVESAGDVVVGRDFVEGDITNTFQSIGNSRKQNENIPVRVAGIDVSQHEGSIDWVKVHASGQIFAFIKATEGDNSTDRNFATNWANAKAAGLLRGAFCYFKPALDPKSQAEYFINTVKSTGDAGELPPVLDLEEAYADPSGTLIDRVKTWLDAVEEAFGKKPIIYSNPRFLNESFLQPDGLAPAWANNYPLWIAQYWNQDTPDAEPTPLRGWAKWTFWQYSPEGQVDGISPRADLNLFNGSLEELRRFAGRTAEKIRLNFALNDRPDGTDRLSYEKYADAFAQVLAGQYTQTPLTVGVYASWGMGKSFLLGKIKKKLELLEEQNKNTRFAFIDFNAWVYSGSENLWAGLVTRLYDKIEEYYGQRLVQRYRLRQALKNTWKTFVKSLWLIFGFGALAVLTSIVLQFDVIQKNWFSARDSLLALRNALFTLSVSSILVNVPAVIKAAQELINSVVFTRAQELASLSSRKDFRDKIGFMADIQSELKHISSLIRESDQRKGQKTRFVMFIDDLDRCPPEKAVEVLEAIMLLLSDQNRDPFIIFLAMDARVLVKAIEMRYEKVLTESGISGYEFLDKIVQIPFRIPPANDDAIKGYVKSLLYESAEAADKAEEAAREEEKKKKEPADTGGGSVSGNGAKPPQRGTASAETATQTEVQKEAEPKVEVAPPEEEPFRKEEKDAFENFSRYISRNPRRVKRIVNIYRLARILPSSPVPVETAIKWVILTEQWPFRIAWIMQKIEDERQLGRPISDSVTLASVYEDVKRYVKEEKSHQLALLDEDGEEFEAFILQKPQITVEAINKLWVVTFNLNPAMQSEVLKNAWKANGRGDVEQQALAS